MAMEDASEIKWKNLPVKSKSPNDSYKNISLIGAGSFGEVYFAQNIETTNFVAIKYIYYKSDNSKRKFAKKEISAMYQIDNEHCVKFIDCFHTNHTVWIVMEYCIGSVLDLIRVKKTTNLTEEEISSILLQIIYGLIYIHNKNFIHRDVKAANMLITNTGIVKIADFGNVSLKNESDTFVSSSYWTAPEICVVELGSYCQNSDVWSLGITAIEIAEKKPPLYDEHDPLIALLHIIEYDPPKLRKDTWSDEFKEFVSTCLVKNPAMRVTSNQLLEKHQKFFSIPKNPQLTLANLVRDSLLVLEKYNRESNHLRNFENISFSSSVSCTSSCSSLDLSIKRTFSGTVIPSDTISSSPVYHLSGSDIESSAKTPTSEGQSDFDDLFKKFDQLEDFIVDTPGLEDSSDEISSQSSDKSVQIEISSQETEEGLNTESLTSSQSFLSKGQVSPDSSNSSTSPAVKMTSSRGRTSHTGTIKGQVFVRSAVCFDATTENAIACYDQMRQDHQKQLRFLLKKLEKAMNEFKQRCWKQFESHLLLCEKEMTKLRSRHVSQIDDMAKTSLSEEKVLVKELKDKYEIALKSLHDKKNEEYAQIRKSVNRSLSGNITKDDFETNKMHLERELAFTHDLSSLKSRYEFRKEVLSRRQALDLDMLAEELKLLKCQMENSHDLMTKNHKAAENLQISQFDEYSHLRLTLVAKQYEIEASRLLEVHKKQKTTRRRSVIKQSELSSKLVRNEVQGVINDFQHRMKEYQKKYQESIRLIKREASREEKALKLQMLQEERDEFIMQTQKELKEKKEQIVSTQIKYAPEDAPEVIFLIRNQKIEMDRLKNSHAVKTVSLNARIERERQELLDTIQLRHEAILKKFKEECDQFTTICESRQKDIAKYHVDETFKLKASYDSYVNLILNQDLPKSLENSTEATSGNNSESKTVGQHQRQNSGFVE